jgi:flavin reductase (DIM6/NTAB) family NADH-FMN oxidoreductase RutF
MKMEGEVAPTAASDLARTLRRRWASGVAVVLGGAGGDGFRGMTVTSFMMVSEEPALVALAVRDDGEFAALLRPGVELTMSVLDAEHEFLAERLAGRAPLPDRLLTGIAHEMDGDLPVIGGALAWCRGAVTGIVPAGDHRLIMLQVVRGGAGADTDDPLLRYEGRYRRLETG